jgi:hypothetical protein
MGSIIYLARLENGTIGTIDSDTIDGQPVDNLIGDIVTVSLHDENGNPIRVNGKLVEVLNFVVV